MNSPPKAVKVPRHFCREGKVAGIEAFDLVNEISVYFISLILVRSNIKLNFLLNLACILLFSASS